MKGKRALIASIIQLVVGAIVIAVFVVLGFDERHIVKWIITLLLAVVYVVFGVIGIIGYKTNKNKKG